jgi:hypothetical protein
MGTARSYLEGVIVENLVVIETDYDASCRSLAFAFQGTTSDGLSVSGTSVPQHTKGRRTVDSSGFTMNVTSVTVTDPVTSQVLASDPDGGFKLYFAIGVQ